MVGVVDSGGDVVVDDEDDVEEAKRASWAGGRRSVTILLGREVVADRRATVLALVRGET